MATTLGVFERVTISVEEAGRLLGISRGSAYEAARRGDIPTIRIGKRLIVPVAGLERLLASAGKGQADGGGQS
jgi:excisionase family DNA binding protein